MGSVKTHWGWREGRPGWQPKRPCSAGRFGLVGGTRSSHPSSRPDSRTRRTARGLCTQRSLLNDRKEGQGQESDFSGSHRNRLFVAAGSCPSGPTLATRLRQRTDAATVFTTLSCKRLPCEIWIDFHSSQFNTSNSRWLRKNTSWSLKIIKVI